MMQEEFERLMGYSAAQLRGMGEYDREREFKRAEGCYMMLENLWKEEFCALWGVTAYRWMILGFCESWGRAANRMQMLGELELFANGVRLLAAELMNGKGVAA